MKKLGDTGDNNQGAKADESSVNGIAKGIKGIVDAAADIAKAAAAVTAVSGEQILKAIVDAAGDGDQAGKKADAAANPIAAAIGADNAGADFGDDMKKSDKIAAAIVLRGVAKDGKFAVAAGANGKASVKSAVESAVDEVSAWLEEMIKAAEEAATKGGTGTASEKIGDAANHGAKADASSVNGIAKGIKGIVDAAGKAFGKDGNALAGVKAAAGADDKKEAGKLFATQAGGAAAGAAAGDIAKAASAVTAVSGEQILKAIVDAAGDTANQAGAAAGAAANPIAAAIGTANDNAANGFGQDAMKKSDKIAAAIVLRGVAKGGKFAVANADAANGKASVKSAVESAVGEVSAWLKEMIKAASEAATKGGTGTASEKIGDADNHGAKADESSVNGIAKGIKGIVDAAGKAFGKDGNALKDVKADAGDKKEAGKLFAGNAGNAVVVAGDIAKAASAVSAVSGEQILKAIVDAAGGTANQAGAGAGAAANPIAAAIGTDAAAANFGDDMKKSDKIAAAIVLRGVAKGGKFAVAAGAANGKASVKSAVESAVDEVSAWLKEMIKAAEEAATKGGTGTASEKIGDAANHGAKADENSVKGIAKGIKGIVDAAGKAFGKDGALAGVAAAGADEANADAGKLFAGNAGGAAAGDADIGKAAAAVSAVSGEQILKAIVDAAGGTANQAGAAAGAAKNPIAAAIGTDAANGANFGNDMKKRNDKIAAAIVLRGVAKDGKFAVADANAANGNKESVKSAVESAVGEVSAWLEEMIKAAEEAATKGGTGTASEKIGDVGANNKGAVADENSVKGIAKGIKGIVDAAGKAFGKDGNALKDVKADAGEANAAAGKLFAAGNAGNGAAAADIAKAASAVSAVSGEQILKAIVDAAGGTANQAGAGADAAANPIAAAIGTDNAGADFGDDMKKSDKIAAAIVLRGVAKDGKFAVAAGAGNKESVKSAVESAVGEVSAWLKEMIKAASEAATKGGTGTASEKIGGC